MMLCAAAAAVILLGSQSQLEAEVSYTCPGLPVPRLAQDLSAACGVKLFAPRAFNSDVVAIRVKGVRLKDAMDRIADLADAEWFARGGRFELVRSAEKQRREAEAELSLQSKMFQQVIDEQSKASRGLEPWNEQSAQGIASAIQDLDRQSGGQYDEKALERLQALRAKLPGRRALARVVASLSARDLTHLPYDYRIVYSTRPTRLQLPMPAGATAALHALVEEENVWRDVESRSGEGPVSESPGSDASQRLSDKTATFLLAVTKTVRLGLPAASVELLAADASGSILERSDLDAGLDPKTTQQIPERSPSRKIVPSEFTAYWAAHRNERSPAAKPPDRILDLIEHPESHDPLGSTVGDVLVKIAEAEGLNMVGELGDEMFSIGILAARAERSTAGFLNLLNGRRLAATLSGDWLTVSPVLPSVSRAGVADREFLGNYLRRVLRKGRADLDDRAGYAAQAGIGSTLVDFLVRMLPIRITGSWDDPRALRLYGLLDTSQRSLLSHGKAILLDRLTPAEAIEANKIVFGPRPGLLPMPGPDGSVSEADWDRFRQDRITSEPTELFAGGLPADSSLSLADESQTVLFDVPGDGAAVDAQGIALRLFTAERPGVLSWMDGEPIFDPSHRQFRAGSRRTVHLRFEFGELASTSRSLTDTFAEGAPLNYDGLPAAFLEAVRKSLAEIRKDYAGVKPGAKRPPKPPPP